MDVTASQIEEIVRQVVQSMGNGAGSAANTADLPKVAHCAMLVAPKKFEVKEIPIPELTDDDILVRVEGAGVCGTDVHEWRQDPFGLIPVVLGHEGTGEVVYLGKNIKCDTAGKPLKVGDKLVTSVISCGDCYVCRMVPGRTNLCDNQGVFGLIGDKRGTAKGNRVNGWFADYHADPRRRARPTSSVNDLNLNQRMLLELADRVRTRAGARTVHRADQLRLQGSRCRAADLSVWSCCAFCAPPASTTSLPWTAMRIA